MIFVFFFNDTATTEIYTLSLHDALPICFAELSLARSLGRPVFPLRLEAGADLPLLSDVQWVDLGDGDSGVDRVRSEEHTSELQSRQYLVCRLLLEKKKNH